MEFVLDLIVMVDARLELAEINGVVGDLFEKLSGEGGWRLLEGIKRLLRGEEPTACAVPVAARQFDVWKTLRLGGWEFGEATAALKVAGCLIGIYAAQILSKALFSQTAGFLLLVRVTGQDLGFTKAVPRWMIYEEAIRRGLSLCPSEAGPRLREQYLDQPMGEWLLVAMEPIACFGGDLVVWGVGRVLGGRWLDTRYGGPDRLWDPDYVWVFCDRK